MLPSAIRQLNSGANPLEPTPILSRPPIFPCLNYERMKHLIHVSSRSVTGYIFLCAAAWSFAFNQEATAEPLGNAFTYQGRLDDSSAPAAGNYDFTFTVFDAVVSGNAASSTLTNTATSVVKGLFTTTLDFGTNIFTGEARWLEISVRTNGAESFSTLAPRQPMTPAPYALFALNAAVAGGGGK